MMNLQNFKLLKEDSDSYHIGHPSGRKITVSKKGMSEMAKKAISDMQQHFDEGGEVAKEDSPAIWSNLKKLFSSSDSAPQTQVASANQPVQIAPAPVVPITPMAEQSAQDDSALPSKSESENALEQEKAAIQAGAEAQAKEGDTNAANYQQVGDQIGNLPSVQEIYDKNRQKSQALFDAYQNGTIDPDRYWNNKTTGSKVLAGIGLFLSGAGSGLAGQPNMAMENINNAINRDIDAQKADQSKSLNLYKMNREMTDDETQATLKTQEQLLNSVKLKTMQAAAVAQGPIAKAKAAELVGNLDQQLAGLHYNDALLQHARMGGGTSSGIDPTVLATAIEPEPEKQKKLLEEVGIAQRQANAHQNIEDMSNTIDKLQSDGSLLTNPLQSRARIAAAEATLIPSIMAASPSKKLSPEQTKLLVDPLLTKWYEGKATKDEIRNDLHALVNTSADTTPLLKSKEIYGLRVPGQHGPEAVVTPVERITQEGKVALFNPKTKQFMGYK